MKLPDVDIDFADRFQVLEIIKHVKASQVIDGHRRHHNSGVYLQRIPHDLDGIAGLDYKTAEGRGYFKFDLLNNGAYKIFSSKEELDLFANKEPRWEIGRAHV